MTVQYLKPPLRREAPRDPALVLYLPLWMLDAGPLMSRDYNGYSVTRTGTIWTPQGHIFDGIDDSLTLGDTTTFKWMHGADDTAAFQWTVIAVLKLLTPGDIAVHPIVATGRVAGFGPGHMGIAFDEDIGSGAISLRIVNASTEYVCYNGITGLTSSAGEYGHLAVSYDQAIPSENARFYLNGSSKGTINKGAGITPSTDNSAGVMTIGSKPVVATYLNSTISEIFIYRRALLPGEVLNHYILAKKRLPWL